MYFSKTTSIRCKGIIIIKHRQTIAAIVVKYLADIFAIENDLLNLKQSN
jgi:hypothetical protein